jgi:orotidine-5'-phosphate decarboxylase
VAGLGATFLTVHAYPQTMDAAVAGAAGTDLRILAVTVLTSSDDSDLARAGYEFGVADLVARRGAQAKACGVSGLVASPGEAAALRASLGSEICLVTPGIRPGGVTSDDQKRVATPTQAIRNGADYLVVGRPVVQASDPRTAAIAIIREIDRAASA